MGALRTLLLGLAGAAVASGGAAAQIASPPATAPVLTVTGAAPAAPPPPRPALSEGVAAVVNSDIISTYDLRQRVLMFMVLNGIQATEQNLHEVEREALRGLVDERLQLEEIKGIESKQKDVHLLPTDKEVEEELDTVAANYGVKRAQLIATLNGAGVQLKTLTDQLTVQQAWRNYIGGRFHGTVRIGEERLNQEQARINALASKPRYQLSEIMIDGSKVGGDEQAFKGAEQLAEQIKKGAPFAAVARQFSSLPTAANGGDSGWLATGEIPVAIETVVANMRPGQVSDPIRTPEGVYIVQLRDKQAGAGATLVSLKQAALRLTEQASAEQVAAATAKLDKLKAETKGCSDLEADAGKYVGVVAGDLGETEIGDLSPEFRQTVDSLKVGQVGGPVRSRAGLHLIALCGRRVSGGKTPSREEIQSRLENEQLSMIARRYLRDLRNSATIESR
jgi:peptidyl-prolyl cis-trans isomerase SurA